MWKPSAVHDDRHTVSGGAKAFGLLMTMPRAARGGNPGCTHPPPTTSKGTASPRSRTRPWFVYTDRKSTRLNSSHSQISYAVFCLKKKKKQNRCNTLFSDGYSVQG